MVSVRCASKECQAKGDICWICMQPWKGGGFAVCGNKDCHTSIVNEELKIENCGTTNEVMSRSDVKCPKLRACPRCLAVKNIYSIPNQECTFCFSMIVCMQHSW